MFLTTIYDVIFYISVFFVLYTYFLPTKIGIGIFAPKINASHILLFPLF